MGTMLVMGSTVPVYRVADVDRAMQNVDTGGNGAQLRRLYGRMLEAGGERFVSRPTGAAALEGIREQCPNFHGVIDDLGKYVELAVYGRGTLNFMPILLAGDPGVGKTHFAKALSQALGVSYRFVSMGTMSAGWVLSGAAPTWAGARHGKIAEALIEDEFANPLFLLDELDKTGGDARYDPYGALLQLMEHDTARHFRDEYLDVELDTSSFLWVATANDLSRIPDPILSRMAVYEVPRPTHDEAAVIAQNIYGGLLRDNGWPFDATLRDDVLEVMADVAPREMRKRLLDGLGAARVARRECLLPADIDSAHTRTQRGIGFLQ